LQPPIRGGDGDRSCDKHHGLTFFGPSIRGMPHETSEIRLVRELQALGCGIARDSDDDSAGKKRSYQKR